MIRCSKSLPERETLATIALDRLFWEWSKGDPLDPDVLARLYRPTDLLSWDDLSARRRVVLLAEAGSGKTEEMREQARLRVAAGQYAFFATVEDVSEDGLAGALRAAERPRLAAWLASDQNAWFFIDSIDEAKLGRVRLDRAFRKIADGISGGERRAHVVLSCRLLDWEFASDLERLKAELPIPPEPDLPPPPPADEVLVQALRHEKPKQEKPPKAEEPLVLLMVALDEPRLRRFASEKGVADVAAFLDQIQSANLWRFARRPLDLDWLVQFWKDHGRFGSLAEIARKQPGNPRGRNEERPSARRHLRRHPRFAPDRADRRRARVRPQSHDCYSRQRASAPRGRTPTKCR
jgi:hypothetical protein